MNKRKLYGVAGVSLCLIAIFVFRQPATRNYEETKLNTINGESLKNTVFTASLDSAILENKSLIWCASFQLAWDKMRNDLIKSPVQIKNADDFCKRMNAWKISDQDLPANSYFAAAGFTKDGIIDQITAGMAKAFPSRAAPSIDPSAVAVAYAYLEAKVKFDLPYFESDEPLQFVDADNKATPVRSFGIRRKDADAYFKLREQAQALYEKLDEKTYRWEEFAIDLCRSSPIQVVVAHVKPKSSLANTVVGLIEKIAAPTDDTQCHGIGATQRLLVPNIAFDVLNHFSAIEGADHTFLNSGFEKLYVSDALQSIKFKLDRSGAELESEAKLIVKSAMQGGGDFIFDRPFLILMRKRGAQQPFFAMWVNNAEMMTRF